MYATHRYRRLYRLKPPHTAVPHPVNHRGTVVDIVNGLVGGGRRGR